METTRRLVLPLIVAALACPACASPPPLPDEAVPVEEAIVGGTASPKSEDAVVELRLGDEGLCSGTLVAPNLVLTARHCVSETDEGVVCAPDGHARSGGRILADRDPAELVVYVGARSKVLVARARGADIVHDGATNLCDHDVAFVVLDRSIEHVPIATLRLSESTHVGERVTAVGWGLTRRGLLPKSRMHRRDVAILDVGPSQTTAPSQFVVGEAICSGDSGGPALSARGAVVGVVSYGGNGRYEPERPALGCVGARARNVYTRVAAFPELVRRAFAEAGAMPRVE